MCHQRTRPSLGGEAGGRSLSFISFILPRGGSMAGDDVLDTFPTLRRSTTALVDVTADGIGSN